MRRLCAGFYPRAADLDNPVAIVYNNVISDHPAQIGVHRIENRKELIFNIEWDFSEKRIKIKEKKR